MKWRVDCSVCGRPFVVERLLAPVVGSAEQLIVPRHDPAPGRVFPNGGSVPCPGEGHPGICIGQRR